MKLPKLGDRIIVNSNHWARPDATGTLVKKLERGFYEVLFDEPGPIGLDGGHVLHLDSKSFTVLEDDDGSPNKQEPSVSD
jgi:hypothetical protein